MLKNLLKYDLKWIYKLIGVFYALALFFAVLSFILSKAGSSVLINILYQISCGFTISMVANCIVNSLMRSWVRFRNNMYKDEAYLTHTLPVSKRSLYMSKVLAAFICVFASTFVSVVCIVLCYYDNDFIKNSVKSIIDGMADSFGMSEYALILFFVFIVFLELMFILFVGYNGIIIGHRSNKGKMPKSIVIGFVMYLAFNVLSLGIICAAGFFDKRIMSLIKTSDEADMAAVKICVFIAAAVYIIYNLILYAIGIITLKKGVNID